MFKKILISSAVLAMILAIIFGNDFASVVGTARDNVQDKAEQIVGLGFKIDRAKHAMKGANEEIYEANRTLATLEVTIKDTKNKLADYKKRETEATRALTILKDRYEESPSYGGGSSDADAAKQKDWMHKLQSGANGLSLLRTTILSFDNTLQKYESAHRRMGNTVRENNHLKEEMTMTIQLAMVQLEGLKAQEAAAGINVTGSSSLAEAKKLIDETTREMEIRSRTVELGQDPFGETSITGEIDMANVLGDIESLLGETPDTEKAAELQ